MQVLNTKILCVCVKEAFILFYISYRYILNCCPFVSEKLINTRVMIGFCAECVCTVVGMCVCMSTCVNVWGKTGRKVVLDFLCMYVRFTCKCDHTHIFVVWTTLILTYTWVGNVYRSQSTFFGYMQSNLLCI